MGRPSKSNPSGWMRRSQRISHLSYAADMPAGPNRWERELWRLGINEGQALEAPQMVAGWVRKNAGNAFVPENILESLGIENRFL